MEIITTRTFSSLYIYLDLVFLGVFAIVLLTQRKKTALIIGFLAGILYFIVDYGIFFSLLGTRIVMGAPVFWLLLWLSMSYGFTNFVWIWLLLDEKSHLLEWSLIPILGWVTVGLLSQNFSHHFSEIIASRGTKSYHGMMAVILCAGYFILILNNLRNHNSDERAPIGRLLLIGIGVQCSWEFCLLICGIRPYNFWPLVVNSLIETNLGMPYIYFIHKAVRGRQPKEDGVLPHNLIEPRGQIGIEV